MGKHAAPRTPLISGRAAKRATAVSLGTFVLCLSAAAPAFATTTTPTPPPVPQPIADVVQQVTDATGLPDPLAPDTTTKPHHHRTGSHTSKPPAPASHPSTASRPSRPATQAAVPAYAPTAFALATLHHSPATRTAALAGRSPAMAGSPTVTRIAPVAEPRALDGLPGSPAEQNTERILLVAVATVLLGGLASGHLKAAQGRMLAW
jgi:hypothetical protein